MKRTVSIAILAIAISSTAAWATDCVGAKGNHFSVEDQLDWCSRDHGFNEGASCGADIAAKVGYGGNVPSGAQPILGNSWDRTNMMGLTRTVARSGKVEEATDMAICCQVHNADAHACLAKNRRAVQSWLLSR